MPGITQRRIAIAAGAIAGFVLLVGVVAVVVISTGAYNIAATAPHTRLTRWLMHTAMERSVAARADEISPPPPFDSATVRHGFGEFQEMCVECHGAPGVERVPLGEGMNPKPPDLAEAVVGWSDRELFWITKHGIKLAGMPAFGVTHSDHELWAIVAFMRQLEDMSPDAYRQIAAGTAVHGHAATQEPHASAGEVAMDRRVERVPPVHAHAGAAATRANATTPAQRAMPGMAHHETPGRPGAAEQSSTAAASGDTIATNKLRTLAAELLRDPAVMARIRADSSLHRRWENDSVLRRLRRPPR